jgi:hypothetical protein
MARPARRLKTLAAQPAAVQPVSAPYKTEKQNLNAIRVGSRVFPGVASTFAGRKLDILPDTPDIRDRIYLPHLRALQPAIYPRIAFEVRDQGGDSRCTGYSLAHVIDFLRFRGVGPDSPAPVSARMLYEMARRNDEWEGTA